MGDAARLARPRAAAPDRPPDHPGRVRLPVGWLVYIFVQGAFTDWYPYPFLDADDLGLGTAIRNSLLVVVLGILLALAFKLTDDRLRLPRS